MRPRSEGPLLFLVALLLAQAVDVRLALDDQLLEQKQAGFKW